MGDKSKIQWTDATWNPTRGCSLVSPGCTNCYAMAIAHRFSGEGKPYEGLTRKSGGRGVWTGDVRLVPEVLDKPVRWRKPRRIFVDSMSDLFHPDVPDDYIAAVFGVMAIGWWHTYQILTKRPERMAAFLNATPKRGWLSETVSAAAITQPRIAEVKPLTGARMQGIAGRGWPLPNVWLGTSVEDQQRADERIPHLLRTPAAVRFLSCEPLLGQVDLIPYLAPPNPDPLPIDGDFRIAGDLHWVIIGGESGQNARACEVAWVRSIRDQCRAAGVPVFVKQLGACPTMHEGDDTYSPYLDLLDSHGGDPEEWEEDLRVREFPA